ncbi:MAG: BatA domain-containing protein [Candidatus Binatia bacterium]
MSLFFLHPIFLFGLVAASLPLVIHLLNRRKLNRLRFPAVRFILLSQKRISRSYRLRHWLLLALRTMALVLLALLLANPIFQTGAGLFAGGGPVSLVLLLDNSLSMTWSGDGIGFKKAKEAARLFISSLNDGDRAAIIPTSISGKEPIRLKGEKEVLLKEIDQIEIADGTANLSAALGKAYEILSEPAGQKEIRFISDLGLTGWDQFSMSSLRQVDPAVPLKAIRVGRKQPPPNGTVKEIRAVGQGVGVDLPLHLEAVVANFSDREIKDLLVQLSIDGQNKDQKLTSLPAKGETTVSFQTRLARAGSHAGQLTLKKDGLAGNTAVHFGLHAEDKLKILVVDGDPQTSLVQSETFFLTRALNPTGERESARFLPTVIIPEGLNAAALDSYQVVVLCNVAALPDGFVAKLQDYLRQGGGLLIFGGDRVQAEHYNAKLGKILQTPVRDKKLAGEASGEKVGKFDLTHPALQGFSDTLLQESIKSARVWGYSRIAASGKSVLISLANGDPLLMEQKIGPGRVIFVTTSADRDWTDLPLKTAYLPMVQSLTNYLAGGKRGILDGGINVGSAKEISLPPNYVGKTLRITKPNKQRSELVLGAAQDRAQGSFDNNDVAGIYRLSLAAGGDKETGTPQLYAVNPPFLESRLDEISERELQAKLNPIRAEVVPVETLQQGGTRTDLALPLLGLLLATLLLEGWVAQRI